MALIYFFPKSHFILKIENKCHEKTVQSDSHFINYNTRI